MDSQPQDPASKSTITFPNGNRSIVVNAPANADAAVLVRKLGIKKAAAVLLLIGGADELDPSLNAQLEQLLDDGLALAAADTEALIIDGGTKAGVMALMGKVVADRGRVTQLLGIAPAGKVTYPGGPPEGSIAEGAALDPNHSHFILVDGTDWSSGTEMMFKVADELAAEARVVAVLINGGCEAKEEVQRCVQRGWPIIVIQGSGRLADEMAANTKLIATGDLLIFPLSGTPADLRNIITRSQAENALVEAWRRFTQYDIKANSEQKKFRKLLWWSLVLGVAGTLLALTQKQLLLWQSSLPSPTGPPWWTAFLGSLLARVKGVPTYWVDALYYPIILVPVAVTLLLTVSNRFKPRKKWILLRGSAEGIKKEIFRYRTRVGDYSDKNTVAAQTPLSREAVLTEKISTISQRLMQTEVNTSSLPAPGPRLPPSGCVAPSDDAFSNLTPTRYLEVRLEDQLKYYGSKTSRLDSQMTRLQWAIFVVGAVGTVLAALGAQLWIALTTALATALSAYIGHLQIEHSLIQYNQAATDLSNVRLWWTALPADEKAKQENRDVLVDKSEKILESELTGWVQQMQDTMAGINTAAEKEKAK